MRGRSLTRNTFKSSVTSSPENCSVFSCQIEEGHFGNNKITRLVVRRYPAYNEMSN